MEDRDSLSPLERLMEDAWLIWSYEHDAWWAPNSCGYSMNLSKAGIYTEAEARQIEEEANRHAGRVEEQARPLAPYLSDAQPGSVLGSLLEIIREQGS